MSITCCERVLVAICTKREKRMRLIVIYGLSCFTVFLHIIS